MKPTKKKKLFPLKKNKSIKKPVPLKEFVKKTAPLSSQEFDSIGMLRRDLGYFMHSFISRLEGGRLQNHFEINRMHDFVDDLIVRGRRGEVRLERPF